MKKILFILALIASSANAETLSLAVPVPQIFPNQVNYFCFPVKVVLFDEVTQDVLAMENFVCGTSLPITELPVVPSTDVKNTKNNARGK